MLSKQNILKSVDEHLNAHSREIVDAICIMFSFYISVCFIKKVVKFNDKRSCEIFEVRLQILKASQFFRISRKHEESSCIPVSSELLV